MMDLYTDHSGQADNTQLTRAIRELQFEVARLRERIDYLQSLIPNGGQPWEPAPILTGKDDK